jgi:hypothetical protein
MFLNDSIFMKSALWSWQMEIRVVLSQLFVRGKKVFGEQSRKLGEVLLLVTSILILVACNDDIGTSAVTLESSKPSTRTSSVATRTLSPTQKPSTSPTVIANVTSTRVPLPTVTSTITNTPTSALVAIVEENRTVSFSMSTASQVAPDDVLEEIRFFGGGGGGPCSDNPETPQVGVAPTNVELIPIPGPELSGVIGIGRLYIETCGWSTDSDLNVTIQFPSGQTKSDLANTLPPASGYYSAHYVYELVPSDPAGEYIVTIEGSDGMVTHRVNVVEPVGPKLYLVAEESKYQVFLHNFVPGESVRFFVYIDRELFGWQEYQVAKTGQLLIETPVDISESAIFVAVGDISGEVQDALRTLVLDNSPDLSILSANERNEIEVQSNQHRTETNIQVVEGDLVTIEYVSGSWRAGPLPTWPLSGPDGDTQVPSDNSFPVPDIPLMALIVGIGEGQPFATGHQIEFTSTESGLLWLGPNDAYHVDNAGSLIVKVKVSH